MVIALDPRPETGSWEYTLKEDSGAPEEQRTVWSLRALTVSEFTRAADKLLAGAGSYSLAWEMLAGGGLVSVRNLLATDGSEIPFRRDALGAIPEDFSQRVFPTNKDGQRRILELGAQVLDRSTLTRADVEKPEPSPED